jgi:hypothetical protein
LQATEREAIEHVFGLAAVEQIVYEASKPTERRTQSEADWAEHMQDLREPEVEVVEGEEAAPLADKPHLTGDPEWDALELAETDPGKTPLVVQQ